MRILMFITLVLVLQSCNDDISSLEVLSLSDYLETNSSLERSDLVACAGGKESGLLGAASEPTDIMFYPIEGATDFRYFEALNVADSMDFSKYVEKKLDREPLFNGYLMKFNRTPFEDEIMGIVTYQTPGKIHVCNPIRQKTNVKPTEVNSDLADVEENGVTPTFSWNDGVIEENIIYFQVISDLDNNFISGTYTTDLSFTFYDLSNVVFNITSSTPNLEANQNYKFTLMGVSTDNWINLFVEKEFSTN